MMIKRPVHLNKVKGFTLIEVMMVVALIGVIVTLVQVNFSSNRPEDILKQSSARFAGIFDLATEYSMLNNIELGLVVEKKQYKFLGYDGTKWSELANNKLLSDIKIAEGVELVLELDDLPIDDSQLFDASTFNLEDDEDEFTIRDQEEKKIIPQVYILSGGDITPFSLSFEFDETRSVEQESKITYRVVGLYSSPVKIEGPFFDGQRVDDEE